MYSKCVGTSEKKDCDVYITEEFLAECQTSEELPLGWTERLRLMLRQQGMEYNSDAESVLTGVLLQSPCKVEQQIDVSLDDVFAIYRRVSASFMRNTNSLLTPMGVADILSDRYRHVLSTGHECLDSALKGGISCGLITEITGTTGVGKTALALHLAMHAASYAKKDDRKARTLWVTSDALAFPAAAAVVVLKWHLEARGNTGDDVQDALCDVAVTIQPTLAHLREFVPLLRRHLSTQKTVRLVVLDGLSILVRRNFPGVDDEVAERHEAVAEVMSLLKGIAQEFHVAVVVTTLSGSELGHSFFHAVNTRLLLTQCLLGQRDAIRKQEGKKARVTHVLELVKSSVSATWRFECIFNEMCLKRVQPLASDEIVLREDATVYGLDPFDHLIVPTFVYS